ncbi:hypothetical protein D3C84_1135270 [compost metagenome]
MACGQFQQPLQAVQAAQFGRGEAAKPLGAQQGDTRHQAALVAGDHFHHIADAMTLQETLINLAPLVLLAGHGVVQG